MKLVRLTLLILLASALAGAADRSQEIFNQGKILMFDRQWEEARAVFQRLAREHPDSGLAPQAFFFIARCLQLQGRQEEALSAYDEFLQKYPQEPFLPAEAHNAVVEISASLVEKGRLSYKRRLISALTDPSKDVRYFAAIRCSSLKDRELNSMIVPVLKEILEKESERDLVDRARISLLRIDPDALSGPGEPRTEKGTRKTESPGDTKMFHIRVYEEGRESQPRVELNIPVSLAEMAIMALDESAKQELRRKGFDIDNIWESLDRLGPSDILTFRDEGRIIKIWIQ